MSFIWYEGTLYSQRLIYTRYDLKTTAAITPRHTAAGLLADEGLSASPNQFPCISSRPGWWRFRNDKSVSTLPWHGSNPCLLQLLNKKLTLCFFSYSSFQSASCISNSLPPYLPHILLCLAHSPYLLRGSEGKYQSTHAWCCRNKSANCRSFA